MSPYDMRNDRALKGESKRNGDPDAKLERKLSGEDS